MTPRTTQIGFSQRVPLDWFERTANLVLAGNDRKTIEAVLQGFLEDKRSVGGQSRRGNREKTITILLRTWLSVPDELVELRDEGLELLRSYPHSDHLLIHWGMVGAVYPFWMMVATHVGRLLRLQGSAAASQVQRRMREQYGERETVSAATKRVLRSFVDWGVLRDTESVGIYSAGIITPVQDLRLTAWLTEAFLHASANDSVPLRDLVNSPGLFPFRIEFVSAESIRTVSQRLDVLRQGLDDDVVMLKRC
jgi:hypothetical protein